jgi:hypothetical protein
MKLILFNTHLRSLQILRIFLIILTFICIFTFTVSAQTEKFCNDGDRRICGTDVGICESGRSICRNGQWTKCEGGRGPESFEICGNNLDDDCDGETDEDCLPWVSFILVGMGLFFLGLGLYYMQRGKGERVLIEGVGKD